MTIYQPNRFEQRDIASFIQSRLCAQCEPQSPDEARKTGYVEALMTYDLLQTLRLAEAVDIAAEGQINRAYHRDVGWRRAQLDMRSLREAVGCSEMARAAAYSAGFYRVDLGGRWVWVNFTDPDRHPRNAVETSITTVTFDGLAWDGEEFEIDAD